MVPSARALVLTVIESCALSYGDVVQLVVLLPLLLGRRGSYRWTRFLAHKQQTPQLLLMFCDKLWNPGVPLRQLARGGALVEASRG